MSLHSQPRENIIEWIHAFHHASDSLETSSLNQFFTQDATLQFGNQELLVGLGSIINMFDTVFPLLNTLKHEVTSIDVVDDKIYMACTITYVVKDDPKNEVFKIPAFGLFHLVEGSKVQVNSGEAYLKRFDVYLDASKIFGRIAEVQNKVDGSIP